MHPSKFTARSCQSQHRVTTGRFNFITPRFDREAARSRLHFVMPAAYVPTEFNECTFLSMQLEPRAATCCKRAVDPNAACCRLLVYQSAPCQQRHLRLPAPWQRRGSVSVARYVERGGWFTKLPSRSFARDAFACSQGYLNAIRFANTCCEIKFIIV